MLQLDLFAPAPKPSMVKLPRVVGRCRETNKFYDEAAAEALALIDATHRMLVISITKTGHVVIDEAGRMDERYAVITITHKADPDHVSETLMHEAIRRGFDEGVRRGVKPTCRS